jgi:glycosyltransferase involved in cell wall biosynthesis
VSAVPGEYEWIPDPHHTPSPPETAAALGAESISACLVVRDEADAIERCLTSLDGVVDEIIVVHDGPCHDATLQISARRGCRVFVRPAYGHCDHHLPYAYEQARGEWLLTIDADEFLSSELRSSLRALVASTDVDRYELLWKVWDGRRYVTERAPFKPVLSRRRALRMAGILHSKGEVDGAVRRVPLHLEHRPRSPGFSWHLVQTVWRPRVRLQAREYLSDLNAAPRFNYPGTLRWTRRREWTNRWAWLLIVPAAGHTFWFCMRDLSSDLGLWRRLRFAFQEALYRGLLTAYVAKERRRATASGWPTGEAGDPTTT